ncbi:MAG: dUTP diphosphatase [Candidatus Kariarchaeaceae archaeon]|jgi:dUTP pyrophosphatase
MTTVKIQLLHPDAVQPRFAHSDDACADISSIEEVILQPGDHHMVRTGVAMALPQGYECQVRPRSGLAANHGISIVNSPGTVDAGYRGEVKVILINLGTEPFTVTKGMRIAQLAVRPVPKIQFETVESLDNTERSTGGFGSTGQ